MLKSLSEPPNFHGEIPQFLGPLGPPSLPRHAVHGVSHSVPKASAAFPGHPFRHADGGDAPRLRHHDTWWVRGTPVVQKELRQLGGFALGKWKLHVRVEGDFRTWGKLVSNVWLFFWILRNEQDKSWRTLWDLERDLLGGTTRTNNWIMYIYIWYRLIREFRGANGIWSAQLVSQFGWWPKSPQK